MDSVKESLNWATFFGYPIKSTEFQEDLVKAFEEIQYLRDKKTSQEILDKLAEKYSK